MPRTIAAILLLSVLSAGGVRAQQPVIPHRQDRVPNRPYFPEEAIEAMTVPPGFAVELVAAEPDIVNPIAMAFDDRGRIWVTESLEYPRKSPGPGRDRVKVLEDADGDGRAESVTVYAGGLNIPTGVAIGHGGAWVLNAPDLLFLPDADGDGRADRAEVVVTGFGRADAHELPSTLTWGPDGWLYGFNGVFNPSRIASRGKEYAFTCALWRVHPRTREFQVVSEGTSNPYGLAWDPEGAAIVEACHWANDHLFHFVEAGYYKRQAGPYPPFTMVLGSITDHSHQKTAYCGLAYFDSDAYPPGYRDRLYTGNIHGGCINADRLARDGSTYRALAEPDFLNANDAWFMPVAQKVGPDGCLYILDWYDRYHCYQDANRDPEGIDRLKGRLYRVRYGDSPRAPRFDLARERDDELIGRLSSSNIYFREAAQRLLAERNTPTIRAALGRLVLDDGAPRKARMHALWALIGTGALEAELHARLLRHADAGYRAWAVRAAGDSHAVGPAIRDAVAGLARDRSPDVQLQVAVAARKIEGMDALPVLLDVLSACGEDRLIPAIAWQNLHPLLPGEGGRFVRLIGRIDVAGAPALAKLLPRAVDRILGEPGADLRPIGEILGPLVGHEPRLARECLAAISSRLGEMSGARRAPLRDQLRPVLQPILAGDSAGPLWFDAQLLASRLGIGTVDPRFVRARFTAADQPESVRLQALDALIAFQDPALAATVGDVLASGPPRLLARVLAALGRSADPKIGQAVLARLPAMDPELQPLAVELLLQREPWARKLLDAVLAGKLPRSTLDANHLRKILESNDREAIWAVEKAWGTIRPERDPGREKVVVAMGDYLRQHPGDPRAGRAVFRKLCAQCHTIHGEGQAVGPDLTSNGRGSFDQLLASVFDPSLVIGAAYQTTTVVTEGGRSLTGLVAEDSDRRIVLRLPGGGQEVVPRIDVKSTRIGRLSMMPEGIENLLGREDLADLFAFLSLDRPPEDPRARSIPGAPGSIHSPVGAGRARRPADDRELRAWLENMVWYHRYTTEEIRAATGLKPEEIDAALKRFDIRPGTRPRRPEDGPLLVLPYPGGRHPRIGFLEGAVDPRRETKVSVFAPWDDSGYIVLDVPEAIFSDLGLIYLAHTHEGVPTIWQEQGIELEARDWRRGDDGVLVMERTLPNGIAFGTRVVPRRDRVAVEQWLTNGTARPLSGLRVQDCVLLKGARGFAAQTTANKVFRRPYVACRGDDGRRWIIAAWEPCDRPWANPPCPCLHSDPKFPDCPPGATVRVRGGIWFYEGPDVEAELRRIEQTGWR